MKRKLEVHILSSLSKIFPDEPIKDPHLSHASVFNNEEYSFQVSYKGNYDQLQFEVKSTIKEEIRVRAVGLVPSNFPIYEDHDEHVLRTDPGLYPDPLYELTDHMIQCDSEEWHTVWISVRLNKQSDAGNHPIHLLFKTNDHVTVSDHTFELEILPHSLPDQQLISTNWFHTDCIATQYNVEVFSQEHFRLIDAYIQTAVDHGMNMLLTPLFTLPLDTEVGGERPTAQLVKVYKEGEKYTFDFEKLSYWIELATKRGIEYIEFSHLFTQWGAYHAPKIVAIENGEKKKIFGWETDAAGVDYKNFLDQFLPALVAYIEAENLQDRVYFHISDEPNEETKDSYKNASDIMRRHVKGFPIIDAMTDYHFYEKGLVKKPIPATDHLEPFLENNIPDLWTYYCCAQYKEVSNRFFSFPSVRNRIIGVQLYKHNIKGFLHWGYNFWYARHSIKSIDPFTNTDADGGFPSGDAFLVYPGSDGPIESIRLKVFYEALQDLQALQFLESLTSRDFVIDLIEELLEEEITFKKYPHSMMSLLNMREKVNEVILEKML